MSALAKITVCVVAVALLGAGPLARSVPPSADADVALSDGYTLHLRALPLGQMDGTILDGLQFDASGTRAAFLARFDGGAVDGDWRRGDPVQAYVLDASSHTMTALTADGLARSIAWVDAEHVALTDGSARHVVFVGSPSRGDAARRLPLSAPGPEPTGTIVSPASVFRLEVFKQADGAYAIGQVGAVRLRTLGVSRRGRIAVVGSFLAWVDGSRRGSAPLAREGPDDVNAPTFSDSAYGRSLVPLYPLGHAVFQSAYRNGVAYFAFTFGIERIVAATTDFVNYSYPQLPADPTFTVGDGLGAGADGILYFARPEDGTLQYWRDGKYVTQAAQFPDDASDPSRLFKAMFAVLGVPLSIRPPVWPDSDAFDAEALEWRVYPIGDVTGRAWVASDLGRLFIAGGDAKFNEIGAPAFPFAVLGRTDDGRLWGASPASRTVRGGVIGAASSIVWSSRSGNAWRYEASVPGDAGAVGLYRGSPWVAFSAVEPDATGIEVARLDGSAPLVAGSTGAIYAGEDLKLAQVGDGFFLISGGEPGTRALDDGGALVALRIDPAALFEGASSGVSRLLAERLNPTGEAVRARTDTNSLEAAAIDRSFAALGGSSLAFRPTIVTNLDAAPLAGMRVLSFDDEAKWQSEYAWRPYPLAEVRVSESGSSAAIARSLAFGPLAAHGDVERWTRDASGNWSLAAVVSRWKN